jgi:hypothetical protein
MIVINKRIGKDMEESGRSLNEILSCTSFGVTEIHLSNLSQYSRCSNLDSNNASPE